MKKEMKVKGKERQRNKINMREMISKDKLVFPKS
jgi:hypothetical protein